MTEMETNPPNKGEGMTPEKASEILRVASLVGHFGHESEEEFWLREIGRFDLRNYPAIRLEERARGFLDGIAYEKQSTEAALREAREENERLKNRENLLCKDQQAQIDKLESELAALREENEKLWKAVNVPAEVDLAFFKLKFEKQLAAEREAANTLRDKVQSLENQARGLVEAAEDYLAESSGPTEFMRPLEKSLSAAKRLL